MSDKIDWDNGAITPPAGANTNTDWDNGEIQAPSASEKDGAFIRGLKRAKQSATITTKLATGDTAGTAETIRDAEIYNQQNPSSKESDELSKAWEDGDGITGGIAGVGREFAKDWRESKGFVSGLRETGKNVNALREGIVSQLGNSVAPMVGLVAGGAAGAAAGTAVPVVGNIAGGIAGGWAGAAAGNTLVEGGGQLQDALHKANIDPMDTVAVEKFVAENGDKILGQSAIKGGIIGAVDTATAGIAGRLLNVPARAAVNRALVDMGVDVADKIAVKEAMKNSAAEISSRLASDTAYQASRTGAENIARNAGAAALDPAGEFTGEYVGQGAATGDWNTKNAALEALSSVGQSGAMFAGQKGYQALTNPFRNGKTGEAAPQSNTPITDAAQATGAFPQLPAPSITVNADGTAETAEDRNARIAARAAGDIADVTPIPNTPEYQDVRGFAPAARQTQALEAPTITVDGNGQALTAQDRNNRLSDRLSGGVTDVTPIQRAPVAPSVAMGLNPANGSLSSAAALAVDSGVTPFGSLSLQGASNVQQTQEAQQAGEGQSQGGRASGAAPKTRAVKTLSGEIVIVNESDLTSGAKSLRTFTSDGKPRAARLDAAAIAPPPPKVVLQNRDRSTSASIQQMNNIVAKPDFLKAGTSSTMDRGAPMVFGDLPSKSVVGRQQQVADDNGKRIPTNYAVVEADDLVASNHFDGTTNNDYANGVDGKLRAVAGNGRVAGLQEAWNRGTTGEYAADLAQEAENLGIDPQALAGFSRPVLVRVMDEADVTADIGDRSNIQAGLQLSALEKATNDTRRMDLRDMEFDDNGDPTADTMRSFVATMPVQERGDMLDSRGLPTVQLIDRIKAAAFKQAYMNDALVELATQAINEDAKRVISALAMAAGDMVQLDGTGEFDIRQAVADAAGLAINAAKKREKLADYLKTRQVDESAEAIAVARFFAENSTSANQIADGLRAWAELAKSQVEAAKANAEQSSMFGDTPTLSRNQLFERLSDENITEIEREQLIAKQERDQSTKQSVEPQSAERAGDADSTTDGAASSDEVQAEDFALNQQTPEEAQALEAEQLSREREIEAAKRKAEEADREAQDRAEVTRRSEAAADNFELGQNAEDSLSGQGDIFADNKQTAKIESAYTPPSAEEAKYWKDNQGREAENPYFEPSARQKVVIEAVGKAVSAGGISLDGIRESVANTLGVSEAVKTQTTENGAGFQSDVYSALGVVRSQSTASEKKKIHDQLALKVGDNLGVLVLNDQKQTNNAVVVAIDDRAGSYTIKANRGASTVQFDTDAAAIKDALNLAKEKGQRGDGFAEFIANKSGAGVNAQDVVLSVGDTVSVRGKRGKFLGFSFGKARVQIDGDAKPSLALKSDVVLVEKGTQPEQSDNQNDIFAAAQEPAKAEATAPVAPVEEAKPAPVEAAKPKNFKEGLAAARAKRAEGVIEVATLEAENAVKRAEDRLTRLKAGLAEFENKNASKALLKEERQQIRRQEEEIANLKKIAAGITTQNDVDGYSYQIDTHDGYMVTFIKPASMAGFRTWSKDKEGAQETIEAAKQLHKNSEHLSKRWVGERGAVTDVRLHSFASSTDGTGTYHITYQDGFSFIVDADKFQKKMEEDIFAGSPDGKAEKAKKEAQREVDRKEDEEIKALKEKRLKNDADKEAVVKAAIDEWLDTTDKTPMQRGLLQKQLLAKVLYKEAATSPITKAEFIQHLAKNNGHTEQEEVNKVVEKTGRAWSVLNNAQQKEHTRKVQEGGKKTINYVNGFTVTKAEYDYANYLINKSEGASSQDTEAANTTAQDEQRTDKQADSGFEYPTQSENTSDALYTAQKAAVDFLNGKAKIDDLIKVASQALRDGVDISQIYGAFMRTQSFTMGHGEQAVRAVSPEMNQAVDILSDKKITDKKAIQQVAALNLPKTQLEAAIDVAGNWAFSDEQVKEMVGKNLPKTDANPNTRPAKWRSDKIHATLTAKSLGIKIPKNSNTVELVKLIDAHDAKVKDKDAAQTPAEGKDEVLRVGIMPNTAEAVTVKDGVVFIGKHEALDFDSGEPVTVPKGATSAQIADALEASGALSSKQRVFGSGRSAVDAGVAADDSKAKTLTTRAEAKPTASTKEAAPALTPTQIAIDPLEAANPSLTDFGEKLGGARKDMVRTPIQDGATANDFATQPLSKIWPSNAHEKVESKQFAAFMFAARGLIPSRPRTGYKLRHWADKAQAIYELVSGIDAIARLPIERVMEHIRAGKITMGGFADRFEILTIIDRENWSRVGIVEIFKDAYRFENGVRVPSSYAYYEVDGKRYLSANVDPGSSIKSVADLLPMVQEKLVGEAEAKKLAFEIRQNTRDKIYFINKVGDKSYHRLHSFNTLAEAREFLKDNYEKVVASWDAIKSDENVRKEDVRKSDNAPRSGRDWREGKDATPEGFVQTFGFRGVEFGNWVSQGKGGKERQGMLNQAYDALMDLAEIIGQPPKALSLGGKLGLGFGSRGSGKASAHFEPNTVVINLTKTKGAGTLAHEWFHALDNYFRRQRGQFEGKDREDNYITYKPEADWVTKDGTRRAVAPMTSAQLRQWLSRRFDGYDASKPLEENAEAANFEHDKKHPNGVRPEVEQSFVELTDALDKSPMAERAAKLDKTPDGYWGRIIERAARSFENYVIAKMTDSGSSNDYLANVVDVKDFVRNAERFPYLRPEEVAPIKTAFDNLFATIQTKQDDAGNTVMFSRSKPTVRPVQKALIDAYAEMDGDFSGDEKEATARYEKASDNLASAQAALEADLAAVPNEGFAIRANSFGGKQVVLTKSAKGDGWQLTRLDQNGEPWGDTAFKTKSQAIKYFIEEADLATIETSREVDSIDFRRNDKNDKAAAQENARRHESAKRLVGKLTAKWAKVPEIVIARNMGDSAIPNEVREHDAKLKSQGASGEPQGFIYKGKVYLLSDQLATGKEVAETLFHEVLGHFGLRSVFGADLKKILSQVTLMRRKDVIAKAREYGLFDSESLGSKNAKAMSDAQVFAAMSQENKETAAEEVLAEMAQTSPELGFVKQAIAAIRNWLRNNVPIFSSLKLTDADIIQGYLLPARGFVTRSKETGAQSLERAMAAFSRSPSTKAAYGKAKADGKTKLNYGQWVQVRTPAFKAWFGDWENDPANASKVIDRETGEPLVVYHGGRQLKEGAFVTDNSFGGIFTNPDYYMAAEYAEQHSQSDGAIYSLFLNIRNPAHEEDVAGRHQGEKIKSAKLAGHDGIIMDARSLHNGKAEHESHVFFNSNQAKSAGVGEQVDGDTWFGYQVYRAQNIGTFRADTGDIRYSRGTNEAMTNNDVVGNTQGDQTETPEFKKWFGDSKVVDADGRPLVVYHGTGGGDFSEFSRNEWKTAYGHFFTPDIDAANGYAMTGDSKTLSVYLKAENPLRLDQILSAEVRKPTWLQDWISNEFDPEYGDPSSQFESWLGGADLYSRGNGSAQDDLMQHAEDAGHDSVIFHDAGFKGATALSYVVFESNQIKSATGNNGNYSLDSDDINEFGTKPKAKDGKKGTPTDRAVMDMVREEKTADEVLNLIIATSRSRFNKQVARLLLKTGALPKLGMVADMGSSNGFKHMAKYSRKYNAISMTDAAEGQAEQIFLHEMVHAATLKALDRKNLASVQMRKLFDHVKKQGGASGQYGLKNVGEFVSEAFTNPDFQKALKGMSAPAQSPLHSAWDYLVKALKMILGLPNGSESALSAALEIGVAVMREDKALRNRGVQGKGKDANAGIDQTLALDVRPPNQSVTKAAAALSTATKILGNKTVSISALNGGVGRDVGDLNRVAALVKQMSGPDGYIERLIVDDAGNVIEGQHRLEALREMGVKDVPVVVIQNFERNFPLTKVKSILRDAQKTNSDNINALAANLAEIYADEKGDAKSMREYEAPIGFEKAWEAGLNYLANNGDFSTENDDIAYFGAAEEGAGTWQAPDTSKFDDLAYLLQDKQIDTKRIINAIVEKSGKIDDAKDVYLQETLFHGRAAKRVKDFAEQEELPLIELLRDKGMELAELEEYLHARHAPEANWEMSERNPNKAMIEERLKKAAENIAAVEVSLRRAPTDKNIRKEMLDAEAELSKWRNAKPYKGEESDRLALSGMSNEEAAAVMDSLDATKRKNLQAAAKMVDRIIAKTRETIVDYGLESDDTVDAWSRSWNHYVPLMREQLDDVVMGGMGTGQGFSIKGKETKGRTGSTKKVVDILANINMQRERAIVRGEKNRVATALLGLVKDNPNKDFWRIAESGEIPSTQTIDKKTGLVITQIDPLFKSRDNALVVKVNGVEKVILFNEDNPRAMRMAVALKNMDAANLEGLLGNVASVTRYLAAVNTQYNPIFGVVNMVRDFQEAAINMQKTPLAGKQKQVLGNAPKAIWQIGMELRAQRKGEKTGSEYGSLWEEFQEQGGQTGYRDMFNNSAERSKELQNLLKPDAWADTKAGRFFTVNGALKVPLEILRKTALRPLLDLLSDYNEAIENGVRLSAYKAALDIGMSKPRAAELAKNLTVNFNRKGQVAQQVGALYAFFNASVQGTARMGQTLFDMEPGQPKTLRLSSLGKKILGGGMLLGSAQAMMLAAAGFGDDEPPEFIRQRNLIIPNPFSGKGYASIPMPLGYHVLTNLGRIPTEYALSGFKNGGKRAVGLVDVLADLYNPLGGSGLSLQTIAPSVIDPFAALAENKDFSGRPIAKQSFNKVTPGHALGRDTSSLMAQGMSQIINYATGGTEFTRGEVSPTPDQIDYLIGQATGGVGREASKASQSVQALATGQDLPWHKIPLVGRFYGDADSVSAKQSSYYNIMDGVRRHAAEVKGLRNEGRIAEAQAYIQENPEAVMHLAANAAERQVKKLRDRIGDLKEQDAPRESIKELEDQMVSVMQRFDALVKSKQKP